MKKLFKKPLQFILKILASRILRKFKPDIIAITGSVGKTSTKDAIYEVLSKKFKVKKNKGSYNNEIGIPLTILGLDPSGSFLVWGKNIVLSLIKILFGREYWDIVILEMGADRPGDISYLTSFIKPRVAVVTRVAPAHLEFFGTVENIAREKGRLVEAIDNEGWAVINIDDNMVAGMTRRCNGKILSVGTDGKADIRADKIKVNLGYTNFDVHYKKDLVLVSIKSPGRHQVYTALSAIACGIIYDMDLRETADLLKNYKPPRGRVNLIGGINKSIIIDDTYNSNPGSVESAINTLNDIKREIPASRRITILGDMLELGIQKEDLHRKTGKMLTGKTDIVFLIGELSHGTFDEIKNDFPKKCFWFRDAADAVVEIKRIMKENDIILVKGSRGMRMERIVEAIKE